MDPFPYMDERSAFLFKNLPLQTPTSPLVHHVRATEEEVKKKKSLNKPPKRGLNEVSFHGNERQLNMTIISDMKDLRTVSRARKLFFFFFTR